MNKPTLLATVITTILLTGCQTANSSLSTPKTVVNKAYIDANPHVLAQAKQKLASNDAVTKIIALQKPIDTLIAQTSLTKEQVKLVPVKSTKIDKSIVIASTKSTKTASLKAISSPKETKTIRKVLVKPIDTAIKPPPLSYQQPPEYSFMRVNRLDKKLTFNNKTKQFTFSVSPHSLEENLNRLTSYTINTNVIFNVSSGHIFPNAFTVSGPSVLHIADQLLRPFLRPSSLEGVVHPNNLLVINYQGTAE
ncbi:hypothetical protein UA38_11575 [Photobacterium kishitanii]|uniref:Pilus assembly protein PilL n=1 Tax=Photobacterium kishitanii TaxID=318456 RepID=A0AAX0YSU2_9GAMM|nr:hypothetical protein [Photobacterium kishitanii]KJG57011.1 hypothetical protein UA38_11575 [Photobacterium kishitanii]KJG60534.1 hypothetical protein UA42_14355 [Photobacterium kishitanii]KJG64834.1 hypothetical protein UA40_14040 [Photobacterium kishitanii]KJG68472.1 hypothetical protein UA41_16460 [Photobacterium kishitanii]PSX18374.1 hypothetical protein C0W70_16015 [Photobacterium kishitanii]